jgi:hypothetical protein
MARRAAAATSGYAESAPGAAPGPALLASAASRPTVSRPQAARWKACEPFLTQASKSCARAREGRERKGR